MKNLRLLSSILCLLFSALGLPAQPAPAAPAADAAYAAFQALIKEQPPAPPKETGAEKFLIWVDRHGQAVTAAGLAFIRDHPGDPRRWEAVLALGSQPPLFAKSYGPDVESKWADAAIVDEVAKAAWEKQVEQLTQALLASTDAPATAREPVEWGMFAKDFRATSTAKAKGEPFDYGPFLARFEAHVARYAALDAVVDRASDYLGALERSLPGASTEIWRRQLDAPNAALRAKAVEHFALAERMSRPLDIAFTAVDGRRVDLQQLRGKVVLVDFWATWCGPCKEEIPNVKKVYAAYHDKGFEIIGISLENASLKLADTPEQAAAKLEKARQVLTGFTAANAMPWPQYFDGKFWKNDLSTRYGINSIPAMFLIDQDGKLVGTDARGEKLEAEVKRLLKL